MTTGARRFTIVSSAWTVTTANQTRSVSSVCADATILSGPVLTDIAHGLNVSDGTAGLMITMPGVLAALAGPALIVASYNIRGAPAQWRERDPNAAALLVERRHLTQNVTLCITELSRLSPELNRRNPIRAFRSRRRVRLIKSRHVSGTLRCIVWRILPLNHRIRHAFRLPR